MGQMRQNKKKAENTPLLQKGKLKSVILQGKLSKQQRPSLSSGDSPGELQPQETSWDADVHCEPLG